MLSFKFSCDKTVIFGKFFKFNKVSSVFDTWFCDTYTQKPVSYYISPSYHKSENLKFKFFFFILQQPANKMSISFNTSK